MGRRHRRLRAALRPGYLVARAHGLRSSFAALAARMRRDRGYGDFTRLRAGVEILDSFMHFRFSLGLVTDRVGNLALSHKDYSVRDFQTDAFDGFRHLPAGLQRFH